MIVFPNCKINLGLQVLRKRDDGYHDISSIFYPVPLRDALEIISRPELPEPVLYNYGLTVNGSPDDNLCIKAWKLIKQDFPELPAVEIHLQKHIPMGAGLGGGSADGSFMLQLLSQRFKLGLSDQQLLSYALQLGSDCPFFIVNKPCIGTGRGEKLQPVDLSLAGFQLILVFPGIHINTGWAFSALHLQEKHNDLADCLTHPVQEWKTYLRNDFEVPVFAKHPELAGIRDQLYAAGAAFAAMSGSGSTLFGLFAPGTLPEPGLLPANCRSLAL